MTKRKQPATHEQIDAMTVPQLRAVLPLLGAPPQGREVRKPDLAKWAHEYLDIGWPATNGTPAVVDPPDEKPAEPRDEPAPLDVTDKLAAIEEAGTDLEVAPLDVLPTPSRWQQLLDIAETVARANVTPAALRGKPADVAVVLLAANDLGIPVTQALQKIGVVDGKLVMGAELMVALVRRDGHTIAIDAESDATGCVVHGRRIDTGEVLAASFTLDDALTAGLIQSVDAETGRPRARSSSGQPMPWERYPSDMLYNRAVSRLCRRLFPDVLGGVSYTPEELGSTNDYDTTTPTSTPSQEPATESIERQRMKLVDRIQALPEDARAGLREEWKRRGLQKPDTLTVGAIRTARLLLDQVEATLPDDAEVVEQPDAQLDAAADQAVAADTIEDAEVVDEPKVGAFDQETRDDLAAAAPVNCATCDRPIQPGLADNGIGEMIMQPVEVNGKPFHAECAPF